MQARTGRVAFLARLGYLNRYGWQFRHAASNAMGYPMATYNENYASKGVAGAGLGLGIAGTALGLLNNNGNGLLGGIFGNNGGAMAGMAAQAAGCAVSDKFSTLEAEIARLKAEKHSDLHDIEVYKQTREENRDLQDRLLGNWIKPLADEAAANKVKIATMESEISKNKEIAELQMKLIEERNKTEHAQINGAIGLIDQRLRCVERTVGEITVTHVPATSVCPLPMPRYNQWSVDPLAATPAANTPATAG